MTEKIFDLTDISDIPEEISTDLSCDDYVVLSDCFKIKPVEDWTKNLRSC